MAVRPEGRYQPGNCRFGPKEWRTRAAMAGAGKESKHVGHEGYLGKLTVVCLF